MEVQRRQVGVSQYEGPMEYTGTIFMMVILWPGNFWFLLIFDFLILDAFQRVLFPLEN